MNSRLGRFVLAATLSLASVATTASSEPTAWFGGDKQLPTGVLTLRSARDTGKVGARRGPWSETWTLELMPPDGAPPASPLLLWRDVRTWEASEVVVTPATARLHVRAEQRDVIVVLVWAESVGGRGWGDAVCVDVFKVPLTATGGVPPISQPLARLVRPRGGAPWQIGDILLGDEGVLVSLQGLPDASASFQLDLRSATWREAGLGTSPVEGIVERCIRILTYDGSESPCIPAPTSRPLVK